MNKEGIIFSIILCLILLAIWLMVTALEMIAGTGLVPTLMYIA